MLSNDKDILLSCLAEECTEVGQIVSKSLRFGTDNFNPLVEPKVTNKELLELEIRDILVIVDLLVDSGVIDGNNIFNNLPEYNKKMNKVLKYMNITKELANG